MKNKLENLPQISIIIPAYNECKGIGSSLEKIKKIIEPLNWEIIVVDDGSEDGTSSIAESYNVKVVTHKKNRGYGASLKTGVKKALHDIICITDADGTYPAECIPGFVQDLISHEQDMVVGARVGKEVAIPKMRGFAKWILRKLANYIVQEEIPDLNSGLRIIRRNALEPFLLILSDGFSFTTTITLAMLLNGYRVNYIPIDYYKRKGKSKIRPVRDTINFFNLIIRIGLYFAPLKIFLPLSTLLLFISFAWALFSYFFLDKLADASTLIIFMTAVQVGVIGLLAELINQRTYQSHQKK